jgi:hypothetical protein
MMSGVLLLASILGIGLLFGWGFGGALRNVAHVQVRLWFLFPIALILQAVPIPQGDTGTARLFPFLALEASYVLLAMGVLANWRVRGFRLILLGLLLNAIPITLNQGMPVSGDAVRDAGGDPATVPTERGQKHHLLTFEDQLEFLGDVISVRPPFRTVISVGDIAMYVGAAWFLAAAMVAEPERPRLPRAPPGRSPRPSRRSGSPR